jgi:hypothetical protein
MTAEELQAALVTAKLVMVRQRNALLAIEYRARQEGNEYIARLARVALRIPESQMPTVSAVRRRRRTCTRSTPRRARSSSTSTPASGAPGMPTERFVITLAGTQGGKTSLRPLVAAPRDRAADQGDYLIAAPSFKMMEPKILPTFLDVFSSC